MIKKTVHGNLTGEKSDSIYMGEEYSTKYTYSHGRRNLLLSQSTPRGWMITYDYLPKTNLRTSILQSYNGKIQERTFYIYDDNGEIISQIEDDGSSADSNDLQDVTYRRINRINRQTIICWPSFGKPLHVFQDYGANGNYKTLARKSLQYDSQGREVVSSIGMNDTKATCYNTSKTYDSFGRIASKTTALNQKTRYIYNDSGEKIEEELVGSGKVIYYSYDSSGCMTSKTEQHESGKSFNYTFDHDALGNLIKETDPYGHNITYSYDRLGNQTRKVVESTGAVNQRNYNILGQIASETDANGNTTQYWYNVYGSKTKIIHPDNSIERFIYHRNGWLKQSWKADGTSIQYKYDPKGRIVSRLILDVAEEVIAKESFVYKGNLLIEKVDSMGLKTEYQYDGAGRKVVEKAANKVTSYTYDDLDRIVTIELPLGAFEHFTYDALDRKASRIMKDSQGKVYSNENYCYDIHGNVIEKKIFQNDDYWVSYRSQYGSDGKILWQEDPHGNRTTWEYDHNFINEKSQKVLACIITDASGRVCIEINDPCARISRKDVFEKDLLVSREEYTYDAAGNTIEKKTTVYADGVQLRDYWVVSTYDKCGRLSSETEMPEGKTTRYSYNGLGKIALKVKPDGVAITYEYDSLGRTASLKSDDVHYTYTYDLHNNVIEAHNHINGSIQKMSYDLHDNLIEEELHAGYVTKYSYDERDRVIKLTLPDGSAIGYVYDPFNLVRVERYTSQGDLAYACDCPSYDLRGNRLLEVSPAGSVNYTYDELNRQVKINSRFWESTSQEFDPVGNLLALGQKDPLGELKKDFAYDRFDHLIKDEKNNYLFDNLGNCLKKNDQLFTVNDLIS